MKLCPKTDIVELFFSGKLERKTLKASIVNFLALLYTK